MTAAGTAAGALRDRFVESLGFALDSFQMDALDALDRGHTVLVAAPTGAGKTVVADYAVERALAAGMRAFYTTPLKALSNQKYRDLSRRLGAEHVGLLTGDNAINGSASTVVMTTEVLRNMLHTESASRDALGVVVLDEVHFIDDPYRGQIWEEVIIFVPAEVQLACLSATVSNVDEVTAWLSTVRGETTAIVSRERPVRLFPRYMIGDRNAPAAHLLPMFRHGRPNADCFLPDRRAAPQRHGHRGYSSTRYYSPDSIEITETLATEGLLPAIDFVFSRSGCDAAARACLDAGVRLTTTAERTAIREAVEARVRGLGDEDLHALGYGAWLASMEAGISPHHAGMVPPFREAVEECFLAGWIKMVFATETLSLGINMPARSVVIERPWKFGGEQRRMLTPGEFAQMTGRAGRRGIDNVGDAVVVWSRRVRFAEIAKMAAAQPSALRSSFRPTYNLTANLLRRFRREEAHRLLNLSFAQYLVDAEVVRLEAELDRLLQAETSGRGPGGPSGRHLRHLRHLIAERSGALAVAFDRSLAVLGSLGYVAGWRLTSAGVRLAAIFHELDLVAAEVLETGLLDGLSAPELAAVASVLSFEPRRASGDRRSLAGRPGSGGGAGHGRRRGGRSGGGRSGGHGPAPGRQAALEERESGIGLPPAVAARVDGVVAVGRRVREVEEASGVAPARTMSAGLAPAVLAWARGGALESVLDLADLAPGDFVRQVKQLLDLLEQVATVSPLTSTAATAAAALRLLDRGVVAASSAVAEPSGDTERALPAVPPPQAAESGG